MCKKLTLLLPQTRDDLLATYNKTMILEWIIAESINLNTVLANGFDIGFGIGTTDSSHLPNRTIRNILANRRRWRKTFAV